MKRSRELGESLPSPSLPPSHSAVDNDPQPTPVPATTLPATPYYADSGREPDQPRAKITSISLDQGDVDSEAEPAMICMLHRDSMGFPSYDAYEAHYNKEHLNRCIECHRNFPSSLYLSLHGDEWHDPFVVVKREKGEHTYACFVEGCERKCATAEKRRRHLIDKHSFPKNFFFSVTQYGIDGRQSLLEDSTRQRHRRISSASSIAKKDIGRNAPILSMSGSTASVGASQPVVGDGEAPSQIDSKDNRVAVCKINGEPYEGTNSKETQDLEMDDLAGAMSAMGFVPRRVRFGRGGKSGFSGR